MNKNKLYENIMNRVAKRVKKSINESFERDEECEYSMIINNCEAVVISDPCYVLPDDIYYNVWGDAFEDGEIGEDIGLVHGTYVGDGSYDSTSGTEYGVDSGTLGIFNIKYCKEDINTDDANLIELTPGKHKISLYYSDGTFYFSIDGKEVESIWTGEDEDEEEYDDYDDSYDEDDEEEYDDI